MRRGFFTQDESSNLVPIKRVRRAPVVEKVDVDIKFESGLVDETIFQNNPLDSVIEVAEISALKTLDYINTQKKEFNFHGIQGTSVCPICNGTISWYWSQALGFERYECSDNDCLPWPEGGAKRRREKGEQKIQSNNPKFRRD